MYALLFSRSKEHSYKKWHSSAKLLHNWHLCSLYGFLSCLCHLPVSTSNLWNLNLEKPYVNLYMYIIQMDLETKFTKYCILYCFSWIIFCRPNVSVIIFNSLLKMTLMYLYLLLDKSKCFQNTIYRFCLNFSVWM